MKRTCRCVLLVFFVFATCVAAGAAPRQQEPLPPPNPVPVAPHELIESAGLYIDALHAQQVLTLGQALSLRVKLGGAREQLWSADAAGAIRRLRAFGNEVAAFARAGVLSPQDAATLAELGARAAELTEQIAFHVPTVKGGLDGSCGQPQPCPEPLVLYVARKAKLNPDGSRARPFRTIAAALAAAEEAQACGVEIRIGPGTYTENIVTSRHTRIIGESARDTIIRGSVLNAGGYDLDVRGLTLASSPAPGGVVVDTCPANVELARLVIDGATRFGVRQHGGALRMFAVEVRDTIAQSDDVYAGSGVRLTGGTRAVIGLSGIYGSGSVGLSVAGPETRAYVAASAISNNHLNPAFEAGITAGRAGYGGAESDDGALLLMQFTILRDNEIVGVIARDYGRVHFRYSHVAGTMNSPSGAISGRNLMAYRDGILETGEFLSERTFAGYVIASGFATSSPGFVDHTAVAVGILGTPPASAPAYDAPTAWSCICKIRVRDSGTPLQVPDLTDFIRERCTPGPPPAYCRTVPMVCDWCGS